MPAVPDVPSAEELLALPHAELAAMLAEAYRVIAGMTVQAQEMTARVQELAAEGERLAARVEALERRAGKDSLLTEQGRIFPQLEGLTGGSWRYGHRSWLRSGIGILRRWWCRCQVRWWRPGTGMSRSD